jgi:hypothetical protein
MKEPMPKFAAKWSELPLLGVAVTVWELPDTNVPTPATIPPALGDALTVIV